jgi:general secretion pathway protein A
MIIQNRIRAGWFFVRSCAGRILTSPPRRWSRVAAGVLIALIAVVAVDRLIPGGLKIFTAWKPGYMNVSNLQNRLTQPNPPEAQKHSIWAKSQSVEVQAYNRLPDKPFAQKIEKTSDTGNKPAAEIESNAPIFHKPSALGEVGLRQNETLWKLIEKVYGVVDPQVINEVARLITMPAIPVKVKPLQLDVWWVKIAEEDSLEKAISLLRSYPDDAPSVRIVPYWTSRSGLKFAVLLRELFYEEASARRQLNNLPQAIANGGKILCSWHKDTVFFADPYMGG